MDSGQVIGIWQVIDRRYTGDSLLRRLPASTNATSMTPTTPAWRCVLALSGRFPVKLSVGAALGRGHLWTGRVLRRSLSRGRWRATSSPRRCGRLLDSTNGCRLWRRLLFCGCLTACRFSRGICSGLGRAPSSTHRLRGLPVRRCLTGCGLGCRRLVGNRSGWLAPSSRRLRSIVCPRRGAL